MNRLRVRLSLAFIGVVVLVLILPSLGYLVARGMGLMEFREAPAVIRNLPPELLPGLMDQLVRIFVRQTALLLFAAALVGSIAGLLVSRSIAAPLQRLADAARAIGARDLSRRVDVTGTDEVRAVARAFNDMASELEQSESLRQKLLADVAHELRTPLTVVQGNLRAILDDVYSLDKAEIARLYDQTRHLTRLVDDLQELAQAEARQLPMVMGTVNVAELVQKASAPYRPLAVEKGIELRVELLGVQPVLQADEARLAQSVQNLIHNGLRHTPAGGTLTIQVEQLPDEVQIRVQDTGEGIAPEHIDYVFDRFYRTDRARSRHTGGSGLGLAIVRAIIEAHGGTVTASSAGPGQGSTFVVHLPRA